MGVKVRQSENKAMVVTFPLLKVYIGTGGLGSQRRGGQIISTRTISAATPLEKLRLIKVQDALPDRTTCGLLVTQPPFNSLLRCLILVLSTPMSSGSLLTPQEVRWNCSEVLFPSQPAKLIMI